ncbi:MAG: hypothetical protein L0Z70_10815 [Chloroflexi bacterium]|nr:hypothetical protein [Chloroflexota bacterium]
MSLRWGFALLVALLTGFLFSGLSHPPSGLAQEAADQRLLIFMGPPSFPAYQELARRYFFPAGQAAENILVLPIAAASNPVEIPAEERLQLLDAAGKQRGLIEQACNLRSTELAAPGACSAVVAPILTRADALDLANLNYFSPDLTQIILLDGSPSTAMQVIGGTAVEETLASAYHRGVNVIASGKSAALLTVAMLAGYNPGYDALTALDFAAVELWNNSERHGFIFGAPGAVIEPQAAIQGHLARLINAITQPAAPRLGIGLMDNASLAIQVARSLQASPAEHLILLIDAKTYQSANTVRYEGAQNTLSVRNLLLHLIEGGGFSYDLTENRFSQLMESPPAPPSPYLMRAFPQLSLPPGAGALFLTGKLDLAAGKSEVLEQFIRYLQSPSAPVLLIVDGFSTLQIAQSIALEYSGALKADAKILLVDESGEFSAPLPATQDYSAVLIIAEDQGQADAQTYQGWLQEAWLAGKPIMAVDGAAPLLGAVYAAHGLPPGRADTRGELPDAQPISRPETIRDGLGLLDIAFEPGVLSQSRWDWLFSLAYARPDLLAISASDTSALMITQSGALVVGGTPLVILDPRSSQRSAPDAQGTYQVNLLLDIFTPGQPIQPQDPSLQSTPASPATSFPATPAFTPTQTLLAELTATPLPSTPDPTRTPRPTPTPLLVPPPSDPDTTHLMVIFGVIAVTVVLFGIFLNRRRVF